MKSMDQNYICTKDQKYNQVFISFFFSIRALKIKQNMVERKDYTKSGQSSFPAGIIQSFDTELCTSEHIGLRG